VRLTDMLGLPLAAMWQQKTRTLLTTLGVVFGSFVLAASMSIGQGVQETIERESHRSDYLRRIDVQPEWRPNELAKTEEIDVDGDMPADKRERIKKVLIQQKLRSGAKPRVPLSREMLGKLAAVEHVESVIPVIRQVSSVLVGYRSQTAEIGSARHNDELYRERLVAGRFFSSPTEPAALVSEYLLYRCGITDEASVAATVGKTLRVELRANRAEPGFSLSLNKTSGADPTPDERAAVDEIRRQLAASLELFNLSSTEIEALRQAIHDRAPGAADEVAVEYPIVGVVRLPTDEELKGPRDALRASTDIVLPVQTATDLYYRLPEQEERGFTQCIVIVDSEQYAKAVVEKISALGLAPRAVLEFIERMRFIYALIFGGMTCVATVALLVAALGIANTMLMSVLERTREIGIMKAVGASSMQLIFIFLVEGALIGLVGGGLGLVLAWGASFPADDWVRSMVSRDANIDLKESLFVLPPWMIVETLIFAVLVTTIAAIYPARRAARIDPVAALRHE
jgi:putative ABC transport system permease protein